MKKPVRIILIILIILFLLLTCFCGYKIFGIVMQYRKDQSIYNELSDAYARKIEENSNVTPIDEVVEAIPADDGKQVLNERSPVEVDFDTLKNDVNREIIAWLYCADTKPEINYPVVHHTDNQYYLTHNAKGEYTAAGALFVGSQNFANFSDVNTVIHGHHLYDGSMFGNLGNWSKQAYFDEHRYFYLNTPYGNFKVEMFAYFDTPEGSRAYDIDFTGEPAIEEWVAWVKSQSTVTSDYSYTPGDQFLTLSTCMYSFANARGVLIGHMIPIAG